MAIKKSELYSSLWKSCDELRGGMDASQYKDYVLTLLFVKYISDKYKDVKFSAIKVPDGASFDDMVALVGTPNIGDDINKKILNKIKEANKLNDFPDFCDETKLGKGEALIKTVSNLILIFNSPDLDFSGNNASDDDLLGDAYEFLMRHFATDSGKSKGQFYTPSEVSRVLARVIGINSKNSNAQTTAYDPTSGSGSLLLKVAEAAEKNITLYGQEKEFATANLAKMNMILHGYPSAEIIADNTLSDPFFKNENDDDTLKTFDYIVANPPFSLKSWSNGVSITNDPYKRFDLGVPPDKNGDYAFLLHILKSLKSDGKAAVVLPHGVLFRGNSEAGIRKNILTKGYIKGIIGLPANLFYGTGIPACILVLDKENAHERTHIFMVDANKGFVKYGNKNRLQEKDIHKIVDVFNGEIELPKYSRKVSIEEVANSKNDYNLNIPRYIDSQEAEDIQNIDAHIFGGIPQIDIEAFDKYWKIFPNLKKALFEPQRKGFYDLKIERNEVKNTIFAFDEFITYKLKLQDTFDNWKTKTEVHFSAFKKGIHPKQEIAKIGESILTTYAKDPLLEGYDMYQHLMQYWEETLQDDFYAIALEGWDAGNDYERLVIKGKKDSNGKTTKDKTVEGLDGIVGKLIPPSLLIQNYFATQWEAVTSFEEEVEIKKAEIEEMQIENEVEDGIFADLDKVNITTVKALLKKRKNEKAPKEEIAVIENYIDLNEAIASFGKLIKIEKATIEKAVLEKYPKLTEAEIKNLVITKKWMQYLTNALHCEQEQLSQTLANRITELADRYEVTLPEMENAANDYETKVKQHLQKMGWKW